MSKPSRQEQKKAEMQLHIMQSAMKLFRVNSFSNTTMEEIAKTAGITKRTLYHHFPMKEALVSAYWLNNLKLNQDLLPLLLKNYPDTRSRLIAVFLSAAEGFKNETEFAQIHFRYQFLKIGKNTTPIIPSDFVIFLTAVIQEGQNEKHIRHDVSATELATQIMFNFTAICLMWFSEPDAFSLDVKLTNTVNCFIDGAGN